MKFVHKQTTLFDCLKHTLYYHSHYENRPIQIYRKIHLQKLENFQIKTSHIFHIFARKHRLWVLVRTASASTEAVLTSTNNVCLRAKLRKIMYTPVNPSFTVKNWGLRGSKLHGQVSLMMPIFITLKVFFFFETARYFSDLQGLQGPWMGKM